jgi:transcription initiation factor TFIIH subunit 1
VAFAYVIVFLGLTETERKQRAALLAAHPTTLKRQYTDMVTGGLITESDFWNLNVRKQMLLEEGQKRQKVGKTQEMLTDLQGETTTTYQMGNQPGGPATTGVKYNLNPEIIHQIFVQYPVVYLAYQEQVPDKMTGLEFWSLFVKSKYAHRSKQLSQPQPHHHSAHTAEDLFTQYEQKIVDSKRLPKVCTNCNEQNTANRIKSCCG